MVFVRFGGSAPNRLTNRPTYCHSRCMREEKRQFWLLGDKGTDPQPQSVGTIS
jgi:hypothetical protein